MQYLKSNWIGLVILAALIAFIVHQNWDAAEAKPEPAPVNRLFGKSFRTTEYEGHKFVTYGDGVVHHPECPCLNKRR